MRADVPGAYRLTGVGSQRQNGATEIEHIYKKMSQKLQLGAELQPKEGGLRGDSLPCLDVRARHCALLLLCLDVRASTGCLLCSVLCAAAVELMLLS